MNSRVDGPAALLISQDLFFVSKITSTADALGLKIEVEGNVSNAISRTGFAELRCVIVDLATPGLKIAELIAALPTDNRPGVIAFGSHVLAAQLQEAAEAGCDEVMPRSKLSASLPEILARYQ